MVEILGTVGRYTVYIHVVAQKAWREQERKTNMTPTYTLYSVREKSALSSFALRSKICSSMIFIRT